jgi:hypothetical protein
MHLGIESRSLERELRFSCASDTLVAWRVDGFKPGCWNLLQAKLAFQRGGGFSLSFQSSQSQQQSLVCVNLTEIPLTSTDEYIEAGSLSPTCHRTEMHGISAKRRGSMLRLDLDNNRNMFGTERFSSVSS